MKELTRFFDNSLGVWESHRSYFYAGSKERIEDSITVFEWEKEDGIYKVKWHNSKLNTEGSMRIHLVDNFRLHRDQGYFTKDPTISLIQSSSCDFLRTITIYNNCQFDERIEFITERLRLRRTIAYKINKDGGLGDVFLVGNYIEKKLWLEEDSGDVEENGEVNLSQLES